MKKITTHSKSGLFLMEMIFVLLFLGLTCGVCVRLFAASYMARMPDGVADQDSICYYFDKHWQNTSEESAVYKMRLVCSASDKVKEVQVTFEKLQNANEETSLYTQTVRFPVFSTKEEADS